MRYSFIILLSFLSLLSSGQFIKDINGRPYLSTGYEQYEGSPFRFEAWVKANVVTAEGNQYSGMLINIDDYKNIPIFTREGKLYQFAEQVVQFTIEGMGDTKTFKKGRLIDPALPDVFFEIISDRPLFIKSSVRKLSEVPTYGEAHKHYRFDVSNTFYTILNKAYRKVSLTKGLAENVFADKWKIVSDYVATNRLSYKSEEDWKTLVQYYKSL